MASTSMNGTAAIYTRISLDKSGEGVGVERQEEACRSLAELHGYTVVGDAAGEVFCDNSLSAYKGVERPRFKALCALIESGEIDRVYVYSTDRLARRTRDLLDLMDLMRPRGVTVHAVTGEGIDPASANGALITTILGAVAEQESAHKAERIRAAYEQRAHSGKPKTGGRRLFGYETDGATIREDEAALLRKAAQQVIDGVSLRSIAADWNAAGFTSTRGNRVDTVMVRSLLKNPYIAGLSTWNPTDSDGRRLLRNRQVVGEGSWPAIIEPAMWERVQAVLSDPARVSNKVGNTPQRLLSGLLLCQCGNPMYRRTRPLKSGEGRYSYYSCKRPVPGTHVHIGSDDADAAVEALVIARLKRTDIAASLAAAASTDHGSAELAALTRERVDLLARRDALEDAVAEGTVAVASFGRAIERVEQRLAEIDEKVSALSASSDSPPLAEIAAAASVEKWWDAADLLRRRAVVDHLVTITVGPGKAGAKKFDPQRLHVKWKGVA
ncbi:recombinase family protein [Gordonia sp. VNK21]|uniref:recombinase family protein n=1 Tax=Gordonia sp. VNK21 TaxID=3382483 RepID=UPI0038D3AF36